MDEIETDVLILGAGIAGSALACALRDTGLDVLALDRSDQPLDTARGDHLRPNTCEIFERWGVLQDFWANGAEKRSGAVWCDPDGTELLRVDVTGLDIPNPYYAFMNHELIATTLMNRALESSKVRQIRPIRNWWRSDDDGEKHVLRVGQDDGSDLYVRAALVVGADGRASRTRSVFRLKMTTRKYEHSLAVVFGRQGVNTPGNFLHVYLGNTILPVIPRTGGGCKLGITVTADEAAQLRGADWQAHIGDLLSDYPCVDIDEFRFADIYHPVNIEPHDWTGDGVVLIGDACHAMHPARSQGMNIAFRCIDELATVLAQLPGSPRRAQVTDALLEYEGRVRAPVQEQLEINHKYGLEMDIADPDSIGRIRERLLKVQNNPSALHAYAMDASGYG